MYVQSRVVFERYLPTTTPSFMLAGEWWVEHFFRYQNSPFSTNEMRYAVITRKMPEPYLKIDWLDSMSL